MRFATVLTILSRVRYPIEEVVMKMFFQLLRIARMTLLGISIVVIAQAMIKMMF
jgi:hypothetical protein